MVWWLWANQPPASKWVLLDGRSRVQRQEVSVPQRGTWLLQSAGLPWTSEGRCALPCTQKPRTSAGPESSTQKHSALPGQSE